MSEIYNDVVILNNWAVVGRDCRIFRRDPLPHEFREFKADDNSCLFGVSYGHPHVYNGHRIMTSFLVELELTTAGEGKGNRYGKTQSGTIYRLGTINPKYEAFLNAPVPKLS